MAVAGWIEWPPHLPVVPAPAGEQTKGADQVEEIRESRAACLPTHLLTHSSARLSTLPSFQAASGSARSGKRVGSPCASPPQQRGWRPESCPPKLLSSAGTARLWQMPLAAPVSQAMGGLGPLLCHFSSAAVIQSLVPSAIAPPSLPKGQACDVEGNGLPSFQPLLDCHRRIFFLIRSY